MSARDTSSRQNGDSRQTHLNTGTRSMLLAETGRVRTLAVKSPAGSTVDLTVDGVTVLAKSDQANGTVAAGATKIFKFGGGIVIPQGSVLAVTSTDANALATVAFMAA